MFEGQYERYLLNRLREELPFSEVPIKLQFSARRRWQDSPEGRPDGAGAGTPDDAPQADFEPEAKPRKKPVVAAPAARKGATKRGGKKTTGRGPRRR